MGTPRTRGNSGRRSSPSLPVDYRRASKPTPSVTNTTNRGKLRRASYDAGKRLELINDPSITPTQKSFIAKMELNQIRTLASMPPLAQARILDQAMKSEKPMATIRLLLAQWPNSRLRGRNP